MTDKPILFSGPMVRALLDGRKTQTRRVLKPWPGYQAEWLSMETLHSAPTCYLADVDGHLGVQMQHPRAGTVYQGVDIDAMSPLTWVRLPYAIGDRLWVREAWRTSRHYDDLKPSEMGGEEPVQFIADGSVDAHAGRVDDLSGRARPGMFMPRWASRLTLIVTDVRVQRLQEISADDARAEGVQPVYDPASDTGDPAYMNYQKTGEAFAGLGAARLSFMTLWDSLNAPRGFDWYVNPWVAAYTFEIHRENIDQMTDTLQQMRTT
ncbi:hypothetical protein KZZ07_08240 [Mameliella sp. CS4]|uniref:hypothetical protein n=1 Tax=Mameliella sp. CS4 TaxID=2862329 RepID=UPI001C5E572B|nr:hypothetical protein [Mameliella sp. CS4]MBW4982527.1 hypothetical protein [Mameliella sp. CS4]